MGNLDRKMYEEYHIFIKLLSLPAFEKKLMTLQKFSKKLTCVELTKTITQPTTSLVQVASISFVQTAGEITQIKQAEISNIYIKNTYIRL